MILKFKGQLASYICAKLYGIAEAIMEVSLVFDFLFLVLTLIVKKWLGRWLGEVSGAQA